MRLVCVARLQGILTIMMSLQLLFEAWKLIPRADRLFHSLSSGFHKSLILVQLERAKTQPSLKLLMPSGLLFELMIEGLPKRGCLRISVVLVGSDLARPDFTFIHAPIILFQVEQGSLLSLGVIKIRCVRALAMHRKSGLVSSVFHQFLPRLFLLGQGPSSIVWLVELRIGSWDQ